jgi:hypothetical protein
MDNNSGTLFNQFVATYLTSDEIFALANPPLRLSLSTKELVTNLKKNSLSPFLIYRRHYAARPAVVSLQLHYSQVTKKASQEWSGADTSVRAFFRVLSLIMKKYQKMVFIMEQNGKNISQYYI